MYSRQLRIAVVGVAGGWSSEKLADTVAAHTGTRILIDITRIEACLSTGKILYDGIDLATLDAVIIKKINSVYSPLDLERLELLRFLQAQGVRVFSRPENILRLISRLACTVTLRNAGIPMPETVITEDISTAVTAIHNLKRVVLKPLFSTKARGMITIDSSEKHIEQKVSEFKQTNSVMYIQQLVDIPGADLGVVFMGGRYIATYARKASADSWNTTINSGGHYIPYTPSTEILQLAEKAQAPFGLDFTCVDVVETDQGPMVFEVSAFGGYRGLLDAHGLDAAKLFTDYVLESISSKDSVEA